jgi:hypothetical protein
MVPAALLDKMSAQVLLMAALHDDDSGGGFRVIHGSRHYDTEPIHSALAD